MPVDIGQWREGIGRFNSRLDIPKIKKKLFDPVIIFKCIFTFFCDVFVSILILKAGDNELNSGPQTNSYSYFSCCHWNVNSSATNYCVKVATLKAYNSIYKYNLYVLSKLFLIFHLIRTTKTLC